MGGIVRHKSVATESTAGELIDYACTQASCATRAHMPSGTSDLPENFFAGYTLRGRIDRGGQGAVYEAIEHSTGRRVAIKVLRSGPFSSVTERMRFDREIRILAELQHPHIVTIHSSGEVEDHRYYVMDFIAGRTLDHFVQEEDLSIDAVLALFLEICEAVHAAHLRGIVHRDLKPSNIRVDEYGKPHVLDFGLAKPILDTAAGESQEATMSGYFVGSLPWAAPEQLSTASDAIDLRTDVHGLGLLLYAMLAKSPPFTHSASLPDVMDDILEREPPPLSSINPRVDDELNTIVSMCLQKDPNRRYQIAGDLARDIERYRAGEPIEAKRDSAAYLLIKTLRRHRLLVAMATAMLLLTIGYGVTVSVLYSEATASEHLAERRAQDASEKYSLARDALEFVVGEVSENLADAPRAVAVRQRILEGAFDRLSALTGQHGDDPRLRLDLMRTHYQLGEIAVQLTRYDIAHRHLQTALDLRLAIHAEEPVTSKERSELSINYVLVGDAAYYLGEFETVDRCYRAALAIDEKLASEYPDNAGFLDNLAWSYDRLGALMARNDDYAGAMALHEKQLAIMKRLTAIDPHNATRLHGLASAYNRLAECAKRKHDWLDQVEFRRHAVEIGRRVMAMGTEDPMHLYVHARHLCDYDQAQRIVDSDADMTALNEAFEIAGELIEREPELPRTYMLMARVCCHLLEAQLPQFDSLNAEGFARAALIATDNYCELSHATDTLIDFKIRAEWALSAALSTQGCETEASEYRKQCLRTFTEARETGFNSVTMHIMRVRCLLRDLMNDAPELLSVIDEAVRVVSSDPANTPEQLVELALACRQVGAEQQSLDVLEGAVSRADSLNLEMPQAGLDALEELRSRFGE